MIYKQVVAAAPPGTVVPKPAAKADFEVKGEGKRRGESALIYYIPNHSNPNKPYQKGITKSELEKAYRQLNHKGDITRKWFEKNMPECNSEGGCNFTTIGGLFVLIGHLLSAG